jgi:UPF0716 family protein affecting phage T7 exclusion
MFRSDPPALLSFHSRPSARTVYPNQDRRLSWRFSNRRFSRFYGLVGIVVVRLEGFRTLQKIRQSLSQGIVPAEEMVDGVLIFIGGILLIIPGVLTDLFALILFIPYTRTIFKRWLRRRFDRMIAAGNARLQYYGRN